MILAYFADDAGDPRTSAGRLAIIQQLREAYAYLAQLKIPEPDRTDQGRGAADPTAYAIRGRILERLGQFEPERPENLRSAIADYQAAWSAGVVDVLPRLVDLLTRSGRLDELDTLSSSTPDGLAGRLSAQALILNGQRARGDALIRQLAPATPGRPDFWRIRMLEMAGRFDELEAELLLRAREARADDPEPWLQLIQAQALRDRPPQAVEATIRDFLARAARTPYPDLLEGQARYAARQWPAADRAFDRAAQAAQDPNPLSAAASYFAATGRTAKAIDYYRKAIALQPKERSAARDLAVVLSGLGDPTSWEEAWTLVRPEASPGDPAEDRLARAIVLARSPDIPRQQEAIPILTVLLADLDPSATRSGQPADLALLAECLLAAGQLHAAETELDRLFLAEPLFPDEARLRAQLVSRRGGPPALVDAVSDRADRAAAALGRAAFELLLDRADPPAENIDAADRIARLLAPRDPALGWMGARVLTLRGQLTEALDACLAVAEAPDVAMPDRAAAGQAALAAAARDHSLCPRAGQVLDAALRYHPSAVEIIALRALIHHELGQYDQEIQLYRRALELAPPGRPETDELTHNLAWALSEGLNQPADALKLMDGLIETHGPKPHWLCTRGVILSRLGQHERAIAELLRSVEQTPDPRRSYYLARAYHAAGQADKARPLLEQVKQSGLTETELDRTERENFRAAIAS
jgi:tetratricopeptide (TPR) repeat protein